MVFCVWIHPDPNTWDVARLSNEEPLILNEEPLLLIFGKETQTSQTYRHFVAQSHGQFPQVGCQRKEEKKKISVDDCKFDEIRSGAIF